ncbi:unnamed protein product, partial [Pelagomonas calceolata]
LFQKLLEAPRTTHLGERVEVEREELLLEGHARLALGEHVARDAEHREAAVGHLGVQLLQLVLALPLLAPEADAVVARVVRRGPPRELDEAREEEDLEDARRRDLREAVDAVGDVRELDALALRDVARELDVGVVHEDADERHHGDAAVLALDGAAAREGLGLVLAVVERVEEARRRLHADLELLDGAQRRGGRRGHRRDERRGAGEREGGDESLHRVCVRGGGAVGGCAMASGVLLGPVCPGGRARPAEHRCCVLGTAATMSGRRRVLRSTAS